VVVGAVTVVAVGAGASLSEAYEDRPDRTIPVGRPLRLQAEVIDRFGRPVRKAGIAELYPALRGASGNPGKPECFLGEIDDILAAADFLARRPDVDPQRIYLGGHSTGGTMVLLGHSPLLVDAIDLVGAGMTVTQTVARQDDHVFQYYVCETRRLRSA